MSTFFLEQFCGTIDVSQRSGRGHFTRGCGALSLQWMVVSPLYCKEENTPAAPISMPLQWWCQSSDWPRYQQRSGDRTVFWLYWLMVFVLICCACLPSSLWNCLMLSYLSSDFLRQKAFTKEINIGSKWQALNLTICLTMLPCNLFQNLGCNTSWKIWHTKYF